LCHAPKFEGRTWQHAALICCFASARLSTTLTRHACGHTGIACRFEDKEVQRDKKLMSYDIVDKAGKPMVQVDVAGEKKVRAQQGQLQWLAGCCGCMPCSQRQDWLL
jgi:hypothetical protein